MKTFVLFIVMLTASVTLASCGLSGCDSCRSHNYAFNFPSGGSCCGSTPW